jgi:hypothetical protein
MSPSGERVGIGGGPFHGIGFALIPAFVAIAMVATALSGIRGDPTRMLSPSFDSAVYQTMAPGVERAVRARVGDG